MFDDLGIGQPIPGGKPSKPRIESDEDQGPSSLHPGSKHDISPAAPGLKPDQTAVPGPTSGLRAATMDRHTMPAINPEHLKERDVAHPPKGKIIPTSRADKIGTIPPSALANITTRVRIFGSKPEMCDACKTMVEELHRRLHALSQEHFVVNMTSRKGPLFHRDWDKAAEEVARTLCEGEKYQHFAPHIREGCKILLHGEKKSVVRGIIHRVHPMHRQHGLKEKGQGYVPKHNVWRKRMICEDVFGVCPEIPPPVPLSACRACAEVFRDFHYVTRRDAAPGHIRPHFKNPVAYRRKRLYGQILDLCEDVDMRHSYSHSGHVQETCHKLVDKHQKQILEIYLNETGRPGCPAEHVCVDVVRDCSKRQFNRVSGHLEHEHDWGKRARVFAGPLAGGEHLEL